MINKVTFNAVNFWDELGVGLTEPPAYPIPAEIKEQVKIKGANGTLTESTGYFNDLTLKLSFRGLLTHTQPQYKEFYAFKRKVNSLFNVVSNDALMFSEVPNKYYKVKACKVGGIRKISKYEVDFEVEFICDPFLYSQNDRPITQTGTIIYNGDIPNTPIISFTADASTPTTIACNGDELTFEATRGLVEINANPYSVVTIDGTPVVSKGTAPIFRSGENTLRISGPIFGSLQIIKNERYLG